MNKLEPKQERILKLLKANKGRVVSHREILEAIESNPFRQLAFDEFWNDNAARQSYKDVLKAAVFKIKKMTGINIKNVYGLGYIIEESSEK